MAKRTLTCLLCMALLTAMLATPATALLGDVNGDEQCTAIDYLALKRYILGTHTLSESALESADLNGDAEINAQDYMLLKRIVLGTYELPAPDEEFPEETLTAIVKLSIILQNNEGKDVATLENALPLDSEQLAKLLEDYFASDPAISEGDIASLLENEEALQTLAAMISQAILDGLLPEQP